MNLYQKILGLVSNFNNDRKFQFSKVELSDAPFNYEYVSISQVLGTRLPEDLNDPLIVANFPNENACAFLTHKIDNEYFHIERSGAIAILLLTSFLGSRKISKLSLYWEKLLRWICGLEWIFIRNLELQEQHAKNQRHKETHNTGCWLVYKSNKELTLPINLDISKKYAKIGVLIDGLDTSAIKNEHVLNVRSLSTAVSLAMTNTSGSPDIKFTVDHIHLNGNNGLVIYPKRFDMGSAGIVTTSLTKPDLLGEVETYTAALCKERKLSSAASLFVLSQQKSNDNLRSFIASWSAFELLVNNLEKVYRDDFNSLLKSTKIKLPDWDVDLSAIQVKDYRFRDRFYAVSCVLNLDSEKRDIDSFIKLNNIRNDYYHEFKITDEQLPTAEVQSLFRKYLKYHLTKLSN